MRSGRGMSKGFSYAELLVVAAVVILLGAVALPRYRQADAAADYAKVLDNFAEIKWALEAYQVDNCDLPESDFGIDEYAKGKISLHRLTTPVAYIPRIPVSPFRENFAGVMKVGTIENTVLYTRRWATSKDGIDSDFLGDGLSYIYGGEPAPGQWSAIAESDWELKSVGPDGVDDRGGPWARYASVYDPASGPGSSGDIVWFSKNQLSR